MNEILVRLRFLIPTLPRAEKAVAQALLDKPEMIGYMTLAELAEATQSSEASIIRFSRKLGYSGYTDMKTAFTKALEDSSIITVQEITREDSVLDNLRKVYESNMQTLRDTMLLASDAYEEALKALLNAKSIHFFGAGDAAAICLLSYYKFKRLGIPGSAQSDPVLQLTEAGCLEAGDVAIAISHEGKSRTVMNAMRVAKLKGASTICITKRNKSPLLKYVDICLYVATSDISIGQDIVARRVAEQMIIDALYVSLMVKKEEYYTRNLNEISKLINLNKVKNTEYEK